MENASKALIMAAGMLIGILILALFSYEMFTVAQTGKTYQQKIDQENILEFNSQFEKYAGKPLSAQEIVTIYNYVIEWNKANEATGIELTIILANDALNTLDDIYENDMKKIKGETVTDQNPPTIDDFLNKAWDKGLIDKEYNDKNYNNKPFTIKIGDSGYNKEDNGRINKISITLYEP